MGPKYLAAGAPQLRPLSLSQLTPGLSPSLDVSAYSRGERNEQSRPHPAELPPFFIRGQTGNAEPRQPSPRFLIRLTYSWTH